MRINRRNKDVKNTLGRFQLKGTPSLVPSAGTGRFQHAFQLVHFSAERTGKHVLRGASVVFSDKNDSG